MKIDMSFDFDYPAEDVFYTFRDKTKEFAKHIPNVTEVKIKEKKKLDKSRTSLSTVWKGFGNIPLVVRAIVKPEMISWTEDDIWDEEGLIMTWKCEPFYFKEFFTCHGKWTFKDVGEEQAKVKLDGILKVYIPSFPGVPDSVAQTAGGIVEKVIFKYLEPNLQATIDAIKEILGYK